MKDAIAKLGLSPQIEKALRDIREELRREHVSQIETIKVHADAAIDAHRRCPSCDRAWSIILADGAELEALRELERSVRSANGTVGQYEVIREALSAVEKARGQ